MEITCCCTLRSWAKSIAWIQIILCCIGILGSFNGFFAILLLVAFGVKDAVTGSNDTSEDSHPNPIEDLSTAFSFLGPLIVILLFLFILALFSIGIVFGVVLLRGARQNNVHYLKKWTTFMIIFSIVYLMSTVLISYSNSWTIWPILVLLIVLPSLVYCIFVIRLFTIQIERAQEIEAINIEEEGNADWSRDVNLQEFQPLSPAGVTAPAYHFETFYR